MCGDYLHVLNQIMITLQKWVSISSSWFHWEDLCYNVGRYSQPPNMDGNSPYQIIHFDLIISCIVNHHFLCTYLSI